VTKTIGTETKTYHDLYWSGIPLWRALCVLWVLRVSYWHRTLSSRWWGKWVLCEMRQQEDHKHWKCFCACVDNAPKERLDWYATCNILRATCWSLQFAKELTALSVKLNVRVLFSVILMSLIQWTLNNACFSGFLIINSVQNQKIPDILWRGNTPNPKKERLFPHLSSVSRIKILPSVENTMKDMRSCGLERNWQHSYSILTFSTF
jgi:hypothetical protein